VRHIRILFVCLPVAVQVAAAQETANPSAASSTTYTFDLQGRRVEAERIDRLQGTGASASRQLVRNMNGREVPVESSQERVISDDGTTKIVERVTRRYMADGQPGPPERARIEERKAADGTVTTAVAVYRGDINGSMQLAERRVTETRTSGGSTTTTTAVERPTINGGLDIVEKREELRTDQQETLTVLRPDATGRFTETARRVVERRTENGTPVENVARYELGRLVQQTVSRTEKVNGAEQTIVDVFESELAGRLRSGSGAEAQPALRERRIVERVPTGDGAVERVSVSRTDPSNPNRLTAPRVVEETVCKGDCGR
jgi:hypothetical protein